MLWARDGVATNLFVFLLSLAAFAGSFLGSLDPCTLCTRVHAIKVCPIRTGLCAQIGRFIVTWGGIGHPAASEGARAVRALNVDTLQVHTPYVEAIAVRSGMLVIPLTAPAPPSIVASNSGCSYDLAAQPGLDSAKGSAYLDGSKACHCSGPVEGGGSCVEESLDGVLVLCGEDASWSASSDIGEHCAPFSLTVPLVAHGGEARTAEEGKEIRFKGEASSWKIGEHICVVGLRARPQHNGKLGVVVGHQDSSRGARVQVRLRDQSGTEVALLPMNLVRPEAESGIGGGSSSDEDAGEGQEVPAGGGRAVARGKCNQAPDDNG